MFYFAPDIRGLGDPTVRHYVRKRTFSTLDRILVHLSSDALQPAEQTQEGIAAATRSGRSTLTKWLKRLEERKLVARDRTRLPGHPLPKFAYRLTDAGWRAAANSRRHLGTELVTVRASNLGDLTVRLAEVPILASPRLDLTATIATVRRGRLDLTRPPVKPRKKGRVIWGGSLRRVDRLFGREDELVDLDAWWSSASRALVLTGLAGIGKSALIAAWIQRRSVDAPACGFEVRPSSTAAGFLSDFAAFLASLGKPGLAFHLDQGVPLDLAFVARLLDRDLGRERILLILDNADQTSRELASMLRRLFLRDPTSFSCRFVLVGRRYPRWVTTEKLRPAPEIRRLRGLDHRASIALLRSRGIGPESTFTDDIVRRTRGHPLLLHLAASAGSAPEATVQRYLQHEVWDALPHKDRLVLEAASVFRRAVGEHTLEEVASADRRALESLVERTLLERTIAGSYVMHDLVREFVGAQLLESQQRRLHARAADVLLKATDSRERWEGVYHLLAAGKVTEAAGLLDSEGTALLDCVTAEDIASLVHGITLDEAGAGTYCVFAEILGDSLRIRGHIGPAAFQYGHAHQLAGRAGQDRRIPRLLRKLGFLERCRNRYSKALGYLVEARARLARGDNPTEMAEVLREMALTEQALGDLTQAALHLNEAADLATDASDRAALCRTLLALGSLEVRQGRLAAGLETNLEGLRVAERLGNPTEVAHAHLVVGTALAEMGKLNDAMEHYAKGNEIARLLGNLRLTAYGTLNGTAALIELGRFKEAARSMQDAEGYFGILEERDSLALLKTYAGQMYLGLGQWTRAKKTWEDGLDELRRFGSPADLAVALKQAGEFYMHRGEVEAGKAHVLEARSLSRRIGNLTLVHEADALLGSLGKAPSPNASD